MRSITVLPILLLTACSTGSGILPSGPDTYTLSERRAPVLGGVMAAKVAALNEASQQCQGKNMTLMPISEQESAFPAGNPWGNTDFTVTFRCVPGGAGNSVDDLQLNDTQYRIIARGDSSTEDIQNLVLLRASQLAINRGYSSFRIDSISDQSTTQSMTTPGYSSTNAGGALAVSGNVAIGSAASSSTFAPATSTALIKPGAAVFITLVRKGTYDARLIYANLAPKYGLPQIAVPGH